MQLEVLQGEERRGVWESGLELLELEFGQDRGVTLQRAPGELQ